MIEQSVIQQVIDQTDIVELISSYIPLKRSGREYSCNCPFHEEKTSSFKVSAGKGIWKCFGCGKGGNAIDFVMEYDGLPFIDAIKTVARRAGIVLDEKSGIREPKAKMTKVNPQEEFSWQKKEFTIQELRILGPKVTAEICEQFSLYSVDYYITRKNDKNESWKVESQEDFPIFIYDYGKFGRIYKPLDKKEYRFAWFGEKEDDYIAADRKTAELIRNARNKILPETEDKLEDLIIVSGGSDALNTYAAGYRVCFMNSETAEISDYIFKQVLCQIANNIYVLYDLDNTGVENAQKLALRFIDKVHIIRLPEELRKFKDRRGNPCKDVKDFFVYYRSARYPNKMRYFQHLVRSSLTLCFWQKKEDDKRNLVSYDISNEHLYGFLASQGLCTIANEQYKRKFSYAFVEGNIIRDLQEEELPTYVDELLTSYIKHSIDHYNIHLINVIHRSKQLKSDSLSRIPRREFDFKSYGPDYDYLFFRNTAVLVNKKGVETVKLQEVGKAVFEHKLRDFAFERLDPPFRVKYSAEYLAAEREYQRCDSRDTNYSALKKAYEGFNPLKRFELEILDPDFVIQKFIYNTGRTFWRKEEANIPLSALEKAEHDLHFISKVCALGYMMYRYKELSTAWMVYGMETTQGELGEHKGGTGKSMFFHLMEFVRTVYERDGQGVKQDEDETAFSGVRRGETDLIYFDDLKKDYDLHRFMPMISSKMAVRNKHENKVVIDFEDSPKIALTSNHPISHFDASLRRRTWFLGFSDYYYSDNPQLGIIGRTPRSEFGMNLPYDLQPADMNKFYNFMAWCLHTYICIHNKVQPPMDDIEKRNIQRTLTDEFIWWADDYFTPERMNRPVAKNELFESWKSTLSDQAARSVRIRTLKEKLMLYCRYKKYLFCPDSVLSSQMEKERREIRRSEDGKDVYYYYIQTEEQAVEGDVQGLPF